MSQSQTNIDAESPDGSMSQSQTNIDAPESDGLRDRATDRRTFMKGCMVAAGAAGGLKYGSTDARAALPLAPIGYAAGGAAIGYLTNRATDFFLGDDGDYSGYETKDALLTDVQTGILEINAAHERIMTSISNQIDTSDAVALAKGKAALIEAMNAGEDLSTAQTAMYEAVEEYYATIQWNIIGHYNAQVEQFRHMFEQTYEADDIDVEEEWEVRYVQTGTQYTYFSTTGTDDWHTNSRAFALDGPPSEERELVTGETVDVMEADRYVFADREDYRLLLAQGDYGRTELKIEAEKQFDEAATKSNQVADSLQGFADDVYNNYEPGEIPTEELVDPITASTELRQDYDGYQAQGAHASMMGIPTSAEQTLALTIHTDDGDYEVLADIYTNYVPNETTDEEGFHVGETYDPSAWDAPLYIAYEYSEETEDGTETKSDFTQIEDSFTIDSATDRDGNDVTSFQTESRNTQTADVESLDEDLAQLREEQLRLQEQAQSGGAGGFLNGLEGTNSRILILVAAVLAAFGLLNN